MSRAALDRDPGLSSPDSFCDGTALHARLAPALGAELASVEPRYLRFKHQRSALVGVRLEWRGGVATQGAIYFGSEASIADAEAKAATLRLLKPRAGPASARLGSPRAVFLAFPNDRAIRGLNVVADARRLKNRLHALGEPFRAGGPRVSGSRSRVELLRFKPERRAVLRATLAVTEDGSPPVPHTWILRAFPPDAFELQRRRWAWIAGIEGVNAPRLLAADPERGWLGIEALPGATLGAERAITMKDEIAAQLRALHAAPAGDLPRVGDTEVLAAARATLADLAALMPEMATRAMRLIDRVMETGQRLSPARVCPIHGDLKLDQWWQAGGSPCLLDWDELAAGDPHLDLASLAADADQRRTGAGFGDWFAREVLGETFDPARAAWHRALAEIRRSRSGLQAARSDWRTAACQSLARAEAALDRLAGSRSGPTAASGPLAGLLESGTRAEMAGTDLPLRLTAVWNAPAGAIARLEDAGESGRPPLWIHCGQEIERFPFPLDPELPDLAGLAGSGRYQALGHRLFRRATLLDEATGEVAHLRPAVSLQRHREKRHSLARRFETFGLLAAVPIPMENPIRGWRERRLPGSALSADAPERIWQSLGETLARAHAVPPPAGLAARGTREAANAIEAPLALLTANGVEPGAWIAERLATEVGSLTPGIPAALVHGDLHPAQIRVNVRIALLDWDAAHLGEPEEDLGNLLAHVEWAGDGRAAAAWPALAGSYRSGGGVLRGVRVAAHARLTLLRILAIHAWRDDGRARALDTGRWERWLGDLSWLG